MDNTKSKKLSPCDPEIVANHMISEVKREDGAVSLIDVGCGRGETLAYLSDHTNWKLYGTDIDKTNLESAHANCPEAELYHMDALRITDIGKDFDVVSAECVFSLLSFPCKCVAGFYEALNNNGVMILADLFSFLQDCKINGNNVLRNVYSRKTLEKFFSDRGFQLIQFEDRTFDMRQMFAQMLFEGSDNCCFDSETMHLLHSMKAGYGIWTFRKS